ncbi:hypothetical protein [Actinomadura sp. B10D3]
MPDPLIVDRVLGDRPFAEIGFLRSRPSGASRRLVIAGGAVGPPG